MGEDHEEEYEGGYEKVASPYGDLPADVTMEKIAAAEYLGAVQAHAQFDTLQNLMGIEKLASFEDFTEEDFEELANWNANDILDQVGLLEHGLHDAAIADTRGREKVASIDFDEEFADALGERTAEILDAIGWPVEEIAHALNS